MKRQEFVEPTTGSYLIVKAKKDGYVYVFHKASSNKNYGVFEEGVAIPYNFIALSNKETLKSPYYFEVVAKQVTADGDTYYVVDRDNATYAKGIDWPENICTSFRSDAQNADGTWNKIGAGGSGVISFPVATGLTYKITAQGSKITASAVCFNATNDLAVAEKTAMVLLQTSPIRTVPMVSQAYGLRLAHLASRLLSLLTVVLSLTLKHLFTTSLVSVFLTLTRA